jgi:hypothetical protein
VRQPLGHAPAVLVVTTTRLPRLGTVVWPLGDIFVTCHDGHRIRLAHNKCSTVIGSDRMHRPVASIGISLPSASFRVVRVVLIVIVAPPLIP